MGRKRGTPSIEWPAYTVERWSIDRLKAYERNARTHPESQILQLRKSLKDFGWTVPVLSREDGTVIAGHGRLTAAIAEGITEAPVIVARGWSEEQCRAYALIDNQIGLNAAWDDEILGVELSELRELGLDLSEFEFDDPPELPFTPNTDPKSGAAVVTEGDVAKAKDALDNNFKEKSEQHIINVACPHCGEAFGLNKDSL